MNFIGFKPTWKYLFMVFAIDFYDFAREHQKIKITFQNWTWNSIAVDYQAKISTLLLNSRPSSSSLQKLQAGMLFATYFYVQIILIRAPYLFVPFLKIRRSKMMRIFQIIFSWAKMIFIKSSCFKSTKKITK